MLNCNYNLFSITEIAKPKKLKWWPWKKLFIWCKNNKQSYIYINNIWIIPISNVYDMGSLVNVYLKVKIIIQTLWLIL